MKKLNVLFVSIAFSCSSAIAAHAQVSAGHRSSAQIVDFIVSIQERRVLEVAEAMTAEKYSFVPDGGGFRGLRSFAEQLKHIAADNYLLGAGILSEKPPGDVGPGENGSDALHTKPEIIAYLKDSFAYMHKAAASIDDANTPIPTPG